MGHGAVSPQGSTRSQAPPIRCGQAIAGKLGRWSRGGASAERMYRTLTDPGYHRATNKHGRRLNKRGGTPMHVMAAHALRQLPGMAGNLTQARAGASENPRPA